MKAAVKARSAAWLELQGNVDAELGTHDQYTTSPENLALAYLLTGKKSYAEDAYAWAHEFVVGETTTESVRRDSYLYFGDYMRQVALVLDWCDAALTSTQRAELADYLVRWTDELWNHNQGSGWGLADPGNNYHMAFIEGTAFAAYALAHRDHSRAAEFTALLQDKLTGPGKLLDYLETRGRGGDWAEGVNYGQRSKQRLFNAMAVLAAEGKENYFASVGFFSDAIYYAVYQLQPGGEVIYPGGDLARDSRMPVTPFDREYVQTATAWLTDSRAIGYGQWYLTEAVPDYVGEAFGLRGDYFRDLLFGRSEAAASLSSLSTFWHAEGTGWLASRSDWGADATSLALSGTSTIDQSHAHIDVGSFTLFKRGWRGVDAVSTSSSGITWQADAHNMISVVGHERMTGPSGGLQAFYDDANLTYAALEGGPQFRRHGDAGSTVQLMDEWTRELVYLKPNTVILYDRVQPAAGVGYDWRLHFASEPTLQAESWSETSGGAGMTLLPLLGGPGQSAPDSDLDGASSYRVVESPTGDGRFLNVLAVALGEAPSLDATALVTSSPVAGALVSDWVVVVSSRAKGQAAPLPFSYSVPGTGARHHVIANLDVSVTIEAVTSGSDTLVTVSAGDEHEPDPVGHLVSVELSP